MTLPHYRRTCSNVLCVCAQQKACFVFMLTLIPFTTIRKSFKANKRHSIGKPVKWCTFTGPSLHLFMFHQDTLSGVGHMITMCRNRTFHHNSMRQRANKLMIRALKLFWIDTLIAKSTAPAEAASRLKQNISIFPALSVPSPIRPAVYIPPHRTQIRWVEHDVGSSVSLQLCWDLACMETPGASILLSLWKPLSPRIYH